MKKIVFLACLVLYAVTVTVFAQENYRPMLKDGKVWNEIVEFPTLYDRWEKTKWISGDTIIDGEKYFKLYEKSIIYNYQFQNKNWVYDEELVAVLQEQDGRVYYNPWGEKMVLYDFDYLPGESFSLYNREFVSTVNQVDSVYTDGILRKRLWLTETVKYDDAWGKKYTDTFDGIWVEGVGCSHGLMVPYKWGGLNLGSQLVSCYEDGVCVFTSDDFTLPSWTGSNDTGIDNAPSVNENSLKQKEEIYDLQGRRVNRDAHSRGVYVKNGKKIIDN